jgi:hypothetical protein
MNFFKRLLLRRKIKKAISESYDSTMAEAVLHTVRVFKRLDKATLIKVWGYKYSPYTADGSSLDAVIKANNPHDMVCGILPTIAYTQGLVDPLEWLTGAKRDRLLPLLNDQRLPALGDIASMVWYSLVNANFEHLSTDQENATRVIIRRVLKGVDKCL